MKKIIVFILSVLLCLLFVGCNKDDTPVSPDDTSVSVADTTEKKEDLYIINKGKTKFRIVYPEEPSSDVYAAARSVLTALQDVTGEKVDITSDMKAVKGGYDKDDYEILIGKTGYAESIEVLDGIKVFDYAIVQRGNKIVIAAKNDDVLTRACLYFNKNILGKNKTTDANGKLNVVFSEYVYTAEVPINSFTIAGVELKNFKIVYANDGYKNSALALADEISSRYGYDLEVVADNKSDPVKNEILIGPTNRAESDSFASKHETELLSYTMGVEGSKFVICGRPYSCIQAASKFSSLYLYSGKKDFVMSDTDICHEVLYTKVADDVKLADGADIRIMTANILAQFESWSTTYHITPVAERVEIFAHLINTYRPDVAGIQEVTDDWDKYIPQYLGDRYEFVYMKTQDNLVNYSTIIYDKTKYDVIDSGVTYFTNKGKNNIRLVTWGVFKGKTNGHTFILFNSHWDTASDEVRRTQSEEEAVLIKSVLAKYPYPYFCTADYNTKQETPNYFHFLEITGAIDAKYAARDAGTLLNVCGGCADLGVPRGESGNSIDHIFMNPENKPLAFATVTANATWDLSDHSPKYVDIKLP